IPSLRTKPGNKPSQIMQLGFCFCKHCLFFVLFSSPLGLWERAMPANPVLRAGPGRHCVTAFCGLQPPFELPLRGGLCGAPPPRPHVRRGSSLPTSLARGPAVTRFARPSGQPAAVTAVGRGLVYQSQLSIRGQGGDFRHPAFRPAGQPSAVQFCSNKIVHAPGHSFGVIQTMLLALPNFGLERMGRNNPGGYAGVVLLGALRAQNRKQKAKSKKQKAKSKKQKAKSKKQKAKSKKQDRKSTRLNSTHVKNT